ncbi:MAG: hypothetical protein H7333_10800 [Bdellovibrionales bacterium]|nr:hypothetical protein [Oligoflexia bacterium]
MSTLQPHSLSKAVSAGNYTLPNNNDGALCTAAFSKVDNVTPANSRLITKPLNHSGHPNVGFSSSDAFPLWELAGIAKLLSPAEVKSHLI